MDAERHSQVPASDKAESGATPVTGAAAAFHFVEIGHFTRPDRNNPELEPATFRFGEQEGLGRGVYIDVSQLPAFATQVRSQAWASHFRYSSSDGAEIRSQAAEGRLAVFGDYYFVFNANTSAEIVHAINQTIDLVERLKENYDVPYEAVTVFYSGRGLEVNVDAGVFGAQPDSRLPQIFSSMTRALLDQDGRGDDGGPQSRGQVDFSAYRYDYLSPLPGTLISSEPRETYKIRLSYGAFKKLSYQRLSEFSQQRPDIQPREPWSIPAPRAAEFYETVSKSLTRAGRTERDAIATLFYGSAASETSSSTLRQLAPALMKRLFDEHRRYIPTPSPQLDQCLAGGLHPGDLHVLAGFPGSGTSTLALQMMNHAASEAGAHCIFAGLQRGVEEQFKRSLAAMGQIPITEIDRRRFNLRELQEDKDFTQKIQGAYERYMKLADRITILEGAAASSLAHLAQLVRERKEQLRALGHSGNFMLVIDSLQLMLAILRTNSAAASLGQELELSAARAELDLQMLTARLKAIARELDIVVLATLEYYDQQMCGMEPATGYDRGRSLSRLFHDTQFADTLMLLHRSGTSLETLRGFYASGGGRANGEAANWQKKLEEIEKQRRDTPEFRHLDSEFAILDLMKNRSGPADKVLLVLHKPFASFEPLDYKS